MNLFHHFPTFLQPRLARCVLCCLLLPLLSVGVQAERVFQTTLKLEAPTTEAAIDRIEFIWSTDSEGRRVGGKDLSGLAVALFAGDSLVYTDVAISEWLLLPVISGVSLTERTQQDIFWGFDTKKMALSQFRSILPKNLEGSSGEHYQIADNVTLQRDGNVCIRHFVDGNLKENQVGMLREQSTRLLKTFDLATFSPNPVPPEELETFAPQAEPAGTDVVPGSSGTDPRAGGLQAYFVATSHGLFAAELAAFNIDPEPQNLGVRVDGDLRPALVSEGMLRFFLGEEDVGENVEIGFWEDSIEMEVVNVLPTSLTGDVGHASPELGEDVLNLPVGEGISRYIVTGIQGDEVWLLDVADPANPRWLTQQAVFESPDGIGVYFETGMTEVGRVLLLPPEQAIVLQPDTP